MKVRLGVEFDRGAWPGPLAARDAVAGETWVGPLGFLDVLETSLGLGGRFPSDAVRAASMVPAIQSTDGFWSASARVDPVATAERLLAWRDTLRLCGWNGASTAARLRALAAVTAAVSPGVPDRLGSVIAALAARGADIEEVVLYEPSGWAPSWRRVFEALSRRGTRLAEAVPLTGATKGDLLAARGPELRPVGDGSLQLVRPGGPLQAAEDVAAWLAARGTSGTVVIGGDTVLDAALRRYGLPTTGAAGRFGSSMVQVLPLVLALGWSPPDPERALELMTLPKSPVPRGIARRLAAALHEWPAVDSDVWREALKAGLAEIDDEARRGRVATRLAALLVPNVIGDVYPANAARSRVLVLLSWLQGISSKEPDSAASAEEAVRQCAAFLDLFQTTRIDAVSEPQLRRLVEQATEAARPLPVHAAQAGLVAVGAPGAIVGPVPRIVWWNFVRDGESGAQLPLLDKVERAELAASGAELPDPGQEALARAARWKRPLDLATHALLLVCPLRGDDGEEARPHPLWDEVSARAPRGVSSASLVRSVPWGDPASTRTQRALRLPPTPKRAWSVPAKSVVRREVESPTSVGELVGCSFGWILHYAAHVHGGDTASLPDAEQLLGDVAHEILARVLHGADLDPARAQAEAERLFDAEGPRLAAALFQRGADLARAKARRATGLAARELARRLEDGRRNVANVEEGYEGRAFETMFAGRPDLVLGPAPAVVDLKWSGSKYRRRQIEAGTAHQLAAYSFLVGEGRAWPPVAFFILADRQLVTTDGTSFPGALVMNGPGPEATWRALTSAHAERWKELAAGALFAHGNPGEGGEIPLEEDSVADGKIALVAPCRWCDLGALCGRAFGGAS